MSLKFAIMGFLAIQPTSGYTLQQRFDTSVKSYWSSTQSQIYRELKALLQEGLVEYEKEASEGKPDRKVYRLTPNGLKAFKKWLAEPVEPQQIRHPFLLKLSFCGQSSPAEVLKLFENYSRELRDIEAEYKAREKAGSQSRFARSDQESLLWKLILDNGLSWVRSELRWAVEAQKRIQALAGGEGNHE